MTTKKGWLLALDHFITRPQVFGGEFFNGKGNGYGRTHLIYFYLPDKIIAPVNMKFISFSDTFCRAAIDDTKA